jgi:hypothetical protein
MRLIKTIGACLVAVVATGAAAASVSYAASTGSLLDKEIAVLTNQGISPARAMQAIEVQSEVARTDIVSKVEAGTGDAFAGVWFEPAAAQLHFGATSPETRRTAEGIVARAGLTDHVTVTPVRSTLAELLATQKHWNRRLASLFARDEVKTGLEPQRNAVSVTLSSSVSSPERAALKREASAANVNVFVAVAESARLSLAPQAKTECKKWARFVAFCNPSITSGVAIAGTIECKEVEPEEVGGFKTKAECEERTVAGVKGKWIRKIPGCTAGPLAINGKKERVLLTAGHCISKAKESWWATNKAEKESIVGPVENFVFGGAAGAKKGDFADILIEPAWQTGKPNDPVLAVTAEWKKMNEKGEETSYPVKGERAPVVNNTNCHVGQTSGESCGEIKMLNVTVPYEANHIVEGLVEDAGANLNGEGGDSGGPWMLIEANQEALMEGLHSGLVPECVNRANVEVGPQFFESQAACFEGVGGGKGKWELIKYKCTKVASEKGVKFYKTKAECEKFQNAGEGEWERTPQIHLVWMPLKQPVAGAAEGPLENLKLELLTTANEVVDLPTFLLLSGAPPVELKGESTTAKTKLETKLGELSGEGLLVQLHWTNLNSGRLGPASLLFTNAKEKTISCSTERDGTGLVLIDHAEWHLVYILLNPLQVGVLILVPTFKITCGAVRETVKGSSVATSSPLETWVESSESFESVSSCLANLKPGVTKYWNDEGEAVTAKLEAEINGLGKFEEACENISEAVKLKPTQMLEISQP